MAESFANQAQTTLDGAINDSVTSIAVASTAGFPSSGDFRIRVDDEFMLVTGGQGTTTWTVTRECEDAARFPAASHSSGATVTQVITAATLLGLSGFSPRSRIILYDECMPDSASSSITAVRQATGCLPVVSGTGSRFLPSTFHHRVGVIVGLTGTDSTGRAALFGADASSGTNSILIDIDRNIEFGIVSAPDVVPISGVVVYRMGLGDSVTGEPTDGIYFRYKQDVNSGKWQGVCRSNGTESVIDTGITPVSGTYHTFGFIVTGAASVQFYVDGSPVGAAITTNIPSGTSRKTALMPLSMVKSSLTNDWNVYIDAYWYVFDFDSPR